MDRGSGIRGTKKSQLFFSKMVDSPIALCMVMLFYGALVLLHNHRYARRMWTNLWRVNISFRPWLTRHFLSAIQNENIHLLVYFVFWFLGNVYYEWFNKQAHIVLGKKEGGGWNLSWSLFAVQVKLYFILIFCHSNYDQGSFLSFCSFMYACWSLSLLWVQWCSLSSSGVQSWPIGSTHSQNYPGRIGSNFLLWDFGPS